MSESVIWALKEAKRKYCKRIKKGDILIFYVVKSRPPSFKGAYEVVGDWVESSELLCDDETKLRQSIDRIVGWLLARLLRLMLQIDHRRERGVISVLWLLCLGCWQVSCRPTVSHLP